ncbi:hypothetical protein ABKV19_027406, partial [Rosa sericea]
GTYVEGIKEEVVQSLAHALCLIATVEEISCGQESWSFGQDCHDSVYSIYKIVPAITELLVAQIMWMDYDNPSKTIYLYIINSFGTQ